MKLIDIAKAHKGAIVLLHNNYNSITGKLGDLYRRILECSYEKQVRITSAQEIWSRASEIDAK